MIKINKTDYNGYITYIIEYRSAMASHEITIIFKHDTKTISADVIEYGGVYDLDNRRLDVMLDVIRYNNLDFKGMNDYVIERII